MVQTTTQPFDLPDRRSPALARHPVDLWQAVLKAREVVENQRKLLGGAGHTAASADLLIALEAYVDSLLRRRLPVPYAMRDELRLQRLINPVRSES